MKLKYLILFLLIIPLITASDEIILGKNTYQSFETLQTEINLDHSLEKELTSSNIVLKNKEDILPINPTIKKISDTKY